MTKILPFVALLWLVPLLGACEDEPENKAERAAAIAKEIRESPDDAEEILDDHDMTIEQFEKLVYEVAADPKLSKQYDEALGDAED